MARNVKFCDNCGNTISNCVCKLSGTGKKTPVRINRDCRYIHENGAQCNREGVVSPDVRGGGPWFCCFEHAKHSGHF